MTSTSVYVEDYDLTKIFTDYSKRNCRYYFIIALVYIHFRYAQLVYFILTPLMIFQGYILIGADSRPFSHYHMCFICL